MATTPLSTSELVLRVRTHNDAKTTKHIKEIESHVGTKNGLVKASSPTSTNSSASSRKPPVKFDQNSHIYMASACCEMLHYRHAAIVVAVVEALLTVTCIVTIATYYAGLDWQKADHVMTVIAGACGASVVAVVLSIALMVIGVCVERPMLLWPHMLLQLLYIAGTLALTVVAVVSMALGTDAAEYIFGFLFGQQRSVVVQNALGPVWPFCLAVIFDFMAAIGIWFYILVRGCYDFFLDKEFFAKRAADQNVTVSTNSQASTSSAPTPTPSNTTDNSEETITSSGGDAASDRK